VAGFTTRSRLATSLAGNPVDLLTITAPEGEEEGGGGGALPLGPRKVVVLSGEAAGGAWDGKEQGSVPLCGGLHVLFWYGARGMPTTSTDVHNHWKPAGAVAERPAHVTSCRLV
jgi:hypothetical protein